MCGINAEYPGSESPDPFVGFFLRDEPEDDEEEDDEDEDEGDTEEDGDDDANDDGGYSE